MSNTSAHVLFTSSKHSEPNTASIWDYKTGNSLKVYRNGGTTQLNSFQQLGNDYFIIADQVKPLLHTWMINKQEPIKDIRMILPNPAKALAISPDNRFLTAAIGTKLYTWEINTGFLLSVVEKHLQAITCLKFAGYYLISTSENGFVVTYAHSDLISLRNRSKQQIEPRYTRNDHSQSITDLHVGCLGVRSRFITVSVDCIGIVYQAATGQLLLKIIFNSALSCVMTDNLFVNIFVGMASGKIMQYLLSEAPRTITDHISSESSDTSFIGHTKRVNCLDIHINGDRLVSGAEDNLVNIWNIHSRLVLHTIDLKSSVTNVRFIWNHANIYAENFHPKYILKTLRRDIDSDEEANSVIVINRQYDIVL